MNFSFVSVEWGFCIFTCNDQKIVNKTLFFQNTKMLVFVAIKKMNFTKGRKMKLLKLSLALVLFNFTYAVPEYKPSKPVLVVLLMVKNEKEVIIPTLETYLPKYIKDKKQDTEDVAYVLYDTGSTDGTEVLAKDFFEKNGIKNFVIAQETFVDFATSRNRGLAIAREKYPKSTFILFPDAEWYFQNFDTLLAFCKEKALKFETGQEFAPPYYRLRMARSDYVSVTPRLMLTKDDVKFEGVVHECPTKCSGHSAPTEAYIKLGTSRSGYEKSKNRWYRDRELLLRDFLANPKNTRSVLYLGLTEKWLGENKNAYTYLKIRVGMPTFEQEDYYALFNLAEVTEALADQYPESYSWQEALGYYHQAFNMRPHRAEPLVRIARHYLNQNYHHLCYLYARRAAEIAVPEVEAEVLPINTDLYQYDRWEILGRCAWYVADYELGEKACKQAIEAHPNSPHLYRNLSFYWERKK
jgi:glycosyltransferase involved in cell wall biosynthesis